jgi:predicted ATPase
MLLNRIATAALSPNKFSLLAKTLHRSYYEGANNKVYLICLTGGPCAGKTTILNHLTWKFGTNYDVFTINELATGIMNSGVNLNPAVWSVAKHTVLTKGYLDFQIATENFFVSAGKQHDKDVLIIADRGTMDSAAYINKYFFPKPKTGIPLSKF